MMKVYRIYTKKNLADTMRDPDDIVINELCYKKGQQGAIDFCREYIKEHFKDPEAEIHENKTELYATNLVSYGETIIAQKIEVKK